jgi:ubiquinone/menaquinone biosynthesis C-methylase UbiE
MTDFHRGFEDVDASAEERSFIQFLDLAARQPSLAKHRDRMLTLCPVVNGSIVLDIGCGLGNETTKIARLVGKNGRAQGIDASAMLIREAQRRTCEVDTAVQFRLGDAHSLPFGDSSFDLCRAERVLLYLENPAKAISEMARVTRPKGHVVVFDFDYGARFIDSDFAPMTRHIEALLAAEPRNPAIGRELPHLMRKANLRVEAIEPATLLPTTAMARRIYAAALSKGIEAGLFTAADIEAWWREQDAREQAGTLYHFSQGYIISASKH